MSDAPAAAPTPMSAPASRFNPWPYSIIAFFAVAIAGTGFLIYLATSNRTELVANDYYDQEIRFQQRFDQVRRTQPWEPKIAARISPEGDAVILNLPAEHAALRAEGTVRLYRPSSAEADRSEPLHLDATGSQRLALSGLSPGRWKVRLQWKVAADDYFAERDLVIPKPAAP